MRPILVLASLLLTLDAAADPARYAIETFDGTLADASWRSGDGDTIVADGGNDGAFLDTGTVVTDMPAIEGLASIYTGQYRMAGIAALGVDLLVLSADPPDGDRPLTLELSRGACSVVQVGKRIAQAERRWLAYTFKVPAWMTSLPNGWRVRGSCGDVTDDAAWNSIITAVTRARFLVGDPDVAYPTGAWQIGFDNARIKQGGKGDTERMLAVEELVIGNEFDSPLAGQ